MSIDVQQPRPYDLVGDSILIGGVAGDAFEAQFNYRIREGHATVNGAFVAGTGTGGHTQFQLSVNLTKAAFGSEKLLLEVFHESPADGSEQDKVSVQVLLGRLIVPGYRSYLEHVVAPGETLWAIAQKYYGNGDHYHWLVAANPQTIKDPSVIQPGQIVRVPQA